MTNPIDHRDIKTAKAARAIYPQVRGMLPKIQLTFIDYDGNTLELDLDHEIAADFLDQADAAYQASIPKRRKRR